MAITVLAFVMMALGAVMGTGLRLVAANRQRVVAANLASMELETVRSVAFSSLELGAVERRSTVDDTEYLVVRETDPMNQDSGAGACAAPGSTKDLLSVRVSVTWDDMGPVEPVRSETILSATGAAADATKGNVAVALVGGGGQPAAGVTVTLSGGPSAAASIVTSSTGCAYFTGLRPGTYSATLNRPGFVDAQGNAPFTISAIGVPGGATTPVQRDFDQAANLALAIEAPGGRQTPAGLPITLANTGLLPSGTRAVTGEGTSRSIGNLFPFPSGYGVWAGACADADPEGVVPDSQPAVRYYPGAQRPAPVATTRGGTTSAVVTLAPVDLTVRRSSTPLAGVQVRAVHADPVACGGAVQTPILLGTTDAAGGVRAALPYGSWRFEVGGSPVLSPAAATVVAPGTPAVTVGVVVP
jgi:hypothetical protein